MLFCRIKNLALILFVLIFTQISCSDEKLFTSEKQFETETWLYKDTITLIPHITDTSEVFSLHLELDHQPTYPFKNIVIKLESDTMDQVNLDGNLNIDMMDNYGKWIGRDHFGKVSFRTTILKGIKFDDFGSKKLYLTQNTRVDSLEGINHLRIYMMSQAAE